MIDPRITLAVTVLGGSVVLIDLISGVATMPPIESGVFDVRLSPDGNTISYLRGTSLCVASLTGDERVIASDSNEAISWGNAEFIAAEEMGRFRGYWWSPERLMLQSAINDSQRWVNGEVRLRLYKGNVTVLGRRSDDSLFDESIATFEDDAGAYNQQDAEGFIKLNALRMRIAAQRGRSQH
mgnify:CR=1 FL=1